jgi:NADPH:quinone reductase-like Zn-dependent oxidoreductase
MTNTQVEITGKGDASVVRVVNNAAIPHPKLGEVLIRVEATSAVFTDMLIRQGQYPPIRTKPGLVLGYDFIGRVEQLGPGVTNLAIGDRVADLIQVGGNVKYLCRPAATLVLVPDNLDAAEAESLILSYMTAYQMLTRWANVQPGQRVLIQGATGAVGIALLQLGRDMNLQMVGTASAPHLATIRQYGADAVDYRAVDFQAQLQHLAADGYDVILDGASSLSPVAFLRLLKAGGILVVYGFTSLIRRSSQVSNGATKIAGAFTLASRMLQTVVLDLLPNGKSVHFYNIAGERERHPDWFREDLQQLFERLQAGRIKPLIAHQFSLDEAPQAHQLLDQGGLVGRIVLRG